MVHEDDDMDEAAMSTIERTENKKTQENDTNSKSETEINIQQELSSSEEALIIDIPSETDDPQNNKIENEKKGHFLRQNGSGNFLRKPKHSR